MNINKEQIDDLNAVLFVEIENDDYMPKVNNILRDYRRKANMPGFRPGKVPDGLIRKMYGKAVLIDEINKLTSEKLQNYITEQQMQLLGELLPRHSGDDFEWEIGNDFKFEFEVGLQPKIEINLSKEDRLTKYQIVVEKETIDSEIENYTKRYGQFADCDAVVDFSEKIAGDIIQIGDDGQTAENGLSAEDTSMLLSVIKSDEHKKPFENAKAGDKILFNLSETITNEWDIVSILKKTEKEEVGDIGASQFQFTVKTIQKFVNAELNQELFDKALGKDVVKNSEEFENLIKKSLETQYEDVSMSKFLDDIHEYFLGKINPQLPEEFLRKWIKSVNKETSEDDIEKEFPIIMKNMKWELIANTIVKQNELKVEENELIEQAKTVARRQFAMYGITYLPDESLNSYAINYLKDEKNVRNAASQVLEYKLADTVSKAVDLNLQELNMEEFNKLVYGAMIEEVAEEPEVEEIKEEVVEDVKVEKESGEINIENVETEEEND